MICPSPASQRIASSTASLPPHTYHLTNLDREAEAPPLGGGLPQQRLPISRLPVDCVCGVVSPQKSVSQSAETNCTGKEDGALPNCNLVSAAPARLRVGAAPLRVPPRIRGYPCRSMLTLATILLILFGCPQSRAMSCGPLAGPDWTCSLLFCQAEASKIWPLQCEALHHAAMRYLRDLCK